MDPMPILTRRAKLWNVDLLRKEVVSDAAR
jgi:hypothetical protein